MNSTGVHFPGLEGIILLRDNRFVALVTHVAILLLIVGAGVESFAHTCRSPVAPVDSVRSSPPTAGPPPDAGQAGPCLACVLSHQGRTVMSGGSVSFSNLTAVSPVFDRAAPIPSGPFFDAQSARAPPPRS